MNLINAFEHLSRRFLHSCTASCLRLGMTIIHVGHLDYQMKSLKGGKTSLSCIRSYCRIDPLPRGSIPRKLDGRHGRSSSVRIQMTLISISRGLIHFPCSHYKLHPHLEAEG